MRGHFRVSSPARKNAIVATAVWLVAFTLGPLLQLKFGALMPGDLGDPRLNNYFLENIYQFLIGRSESLWHLGFFYPHPWILGLSDNLFGAAPVYLASRFAQIPSDTSFQIWFLASYGANYAAAYIALRRLKLSLPASILGALIFSFALPVPSQFEHAQLMYRFGAALAIGEAVRFVTEGGWKRLYASGAWLVWQFYCSIYIGFFALVFIAAVYGVHVISQVVRHITSRARNAGGKLGQGPSSWIRYAGAWWGERSGRDRAVLVGAPVVLLASMTLLMYPYLQSSRLFAAKRTFEAIESDMPRLWSYLVSDHSLLWAHNARQLGVGHFEEHQLFLGAVALALLAVGVWVAWRNPGERVGRSMAAALAITFVASLDVGGHSVWELLVRLPLFSAIRVVSRFDLVWLFPVAYLGGLAVDRLIVGRLSVPATARSRLRGLAPYAAIALLAAALIAEYSFVVPLTTEKAAWRARLEAADAQTPDTLAGGAILAFATPDAPWRAAMELDGMWVALNRGVYTMNGYAGFGMPGYNMPAGTDRSQVLERLGWYLVYAGQAGDAAAYQSLAERVVLVGFDPSDTADTSWLTAPHTFTLSERPYTDAEMAGLSVRVVGRDPSRGMGVIDIDVVNDGVITISAESFAEQQVNVVWRLVSADGVPMAWHQRALPCDLRPGESVRMRVLVDVTVGEEGGSIEFGFEQEGLTPPTSLGTPESRASWTDR